MDKAKNDLKLRHGRIATLPQVPGFLELIEELEAAEARAWASMQAEWKLGAAVDQRKVDEMRGVASMIRKLKKGPDVAAKSLERIEEKEVTDGV